MSAVFPEYERQLVALGRDRAAGASGARRRRSWWSVGIVIPVLAVLSSLAIFFGALVSLHSSGSSAGNAAQASLKSLVAQYGVLRRPQTAADRALAGPAPTIGGISGFGAGSGATGYHLTTYYRVRISGLSHYVAIPTMTRVVVTGGVRVALFVERYVRVNTLPKVMITGNDRKGAERELSRWLRLQRRIGGLPSGDILVVKVPGERARALSPLTGYSKRLLRADPDAIGAGQVADASFPAPGEKIVAIEPDGVASVSWHWPREWDGLLLEYLPPASLTAPVSSNVAVVAAPARFAGSYSIGPYAVTLTGTDGAALGHYVSDTNSAGIWLSTTPGSSTPGPATSLTREAQRNPATPNHIYLVPSSVSLRTTRSGPGFQIEFRNLLNNASYYATITNTAHAACVRPNVRGLVSYGAALQLSGDGPAARGTIFTGSLPVMLRCRGTYRVGVAVIGPQHCPRAVRQRHADRPLSSFVAWPVGCFATHASVGRLVRCSQRGSSHEVRIRPLVRRAFPFCDDPEEAPNAFQPPSEACAWPSASARRACGRSPIQ
ncbi:MAG: hypothetical protein ACLP50_31095 [Solirubrobacteraceae bacterium]